MEIPPQRNKNRFANFIERINPLLIHPIFPWLILLVLIAGIILREPRFFTEPRFWAEEGQVFYTLAIHNHWYIALFRPVIAQGYYAFLLHFIAVFASRFFPLVDGPAVTTFAAFLALITAVVIVLWGTSGLFRS